MNSEFQIDLCLFIFVKHLLFYSKEIMLLLPDLTLTAAPGMRNACCEKCLLSHCTDGSGIVPRSHLWLTGHPGSSFHSSPTVPLLPSIYSVNTFSEVEVP